MLRYILILLLCPVFVFAQNITPQGATNQVNYQRGGNGADSALAIPVFADTIKANTFLNYRKEGRIIVTRTPRYFWFNDSQKWVALGAVGSELTWSDTTVLATKSDLNGKINWSDTLNRLIVTKKYADSLIAYLNGLKQNYTDTLTWDATISDLNNAIANIPTPNLQQVTDEGYITTNPIIALGLASNTVISIQSTTPDTYVTWMSPVTGGGNYNIHLPYRDGDMVGYNNDSILLYSQLNKLPAVTTLAPSGYATDQSANYTDLSWVTKGDLDAVTNDVYILNNYPGFIANDGLDDSEPMMGALRDAVNKGYHIVMALGGAYNMIDTTVYFPMSINKFYGSGIGTTIFTAENGVAIMFRKEGTFDTLAKLASIVRKGDTTIPLVSPVTIKHGAIVAITDTASYSFNSDRAEYQQGEFVYNRDDINAGTVLRVQTMVIGEQYHDTSSFAFVMEPNTFEMSDMTIDGRAGGGASDFGVIVKNLINPVFRNIELKQINARGIWITGCLGGGCYNILDPVQGGVGSFGGNETYYAISGGGWQGGEISNCILGSRRHSVSLSNTTTTSFAIVNRYINVHDCYLSGDSLAAAADFHGNVEYCSFSKCYLVGGAHIAGDNTVLDDNDIFTTDKNPIAIEIVHINSPNHTITNNRVEVIEGDPNLLKGLTYSDEDIRESGTINISGNTFRSNLSVSNPLFYFSPPVNATPSYVTNINWINNHSYVNGSVNGTLRIQGTNLTTRRYGKINIQGGTFDNTGIFITFATNININGVLSNNAYSNGIRLESFGVARVTNSVVDSSNRGGTSGLGLTRIYATTGDTLFINGVCGLSSYSTNATWFNNVRKVYRGATMFTGSGEDSVTGTTDVQPWAWPGVWQVFNGGTGQSSYAIGDVLYANTTTSLARRAAVATGNALISGGVNTAPSWGKIGLTTHVSGTLPVANGGTGLSTLGTANQQLRVNAGATALEYFGGVVTSNAGTLSLVYGTDYFFNGTTTTWTLPAIAATSAGRTYMITVSNIGSGNITINTNAAANVLYTTGTTITNTMTVAPGEAFDFMPNGVYIKVR